MKLQAAAGRKYATTCPGYLAPPLWRSGAPVVTFSNNTFLRYLGTRSCQRPNAFTLEEARHALAHSVL